LGEIKERSVYRVRKIKDKTGFVWGVAPVRRERKYRKGVGGEYDGNSM
jgi:hypothetical protein